MHNPMRSEPSSVRAAFQAVESCVLPDWLMSTYVKRRSASQTAWTETAWKSLRQKYL